MDSLETSIAMCKELLENFLLNSESLPICSKNADLSLDSDVASYLVKNGYEKFLVKDISFGYQVGGISEKVLIEFARSKRVFEGRAGKFRIKENYWIHSARYFKALPVS